MFPYTSSVECVSCLELKHWFNSKINKTNRRTS
jgi:hypothetical protein